MEDIAVSCESTPPPAPTGLGWGRDTRKGKVGVRGIRHRDRCRSKILGCRVFRLGVRINIRVSIRVSIRDTVRDSIWLSARVILG